MSQFDQTATYAFQNVVVIISHPKVAMTHVVGGFMPDATISIERENETWTKVVSPDGKFVTRIKNADKSATIALPLISSSPSNDVLGAIANYDEAGDNNDGLFSITVADKNGRSVYHSNQAFVGVPMSQEFGVAESVREWSVMAGNLESVIGGNVKLDQATIAMLNALGVSVADTWVLP